MMHFNNHRRWNDARLAACVCALMLTLVLGLASTPARADLQGQIDSMFSAMSNVTSPTAVMGQRRGLLAGGRYSVRTKIMDIQVITALPPSINAGCAGIDLFGGSFSFISADQFVQSLRFIAANAAGYAFKVAMETMCPTCAAVMSSLRKLMNKMNSLATNSCQAAKNLVNVAASAAGFDIQAARVATADKSASIATKIGAAVDSLAAMFPSIGNNGSSQSKVGATSAGVQKLEEQGVIGNVVWQALNEEGVSSWWAGGDVDFLEAIMSVSGSIVIHKVTDPNKDPEITPLAPVLDIKSFLRGTSGSSTTEVQMYECGGGASGSGYDACYSPSVVDANITSFTAKVREMAIRVTQKYVTNTDFDTDELAFIQAAPASVGATLRNLARMTPGMAISYANQASGVIAQIMASDLVMKMMRTATIAMASSTAPTAVQMRAEFQRVAASLHDQAMTVQGELQNLSGLVGTYNGLMTAAQKRRMGLGQLINRLGGAQ